MTALARQPAPREDSARLCIQRHAVRRVLLVLQSVAVGGMETHSVDLGGEFVRRGIEVTVVLPEHRVFDALADRFHAGGATVVRLDTDARRGRIAQAWACLQLALLCRSWRPDVVHLHTGGATGGLAVLAAARSVRHTTVVLTEHDVPDPRPGLHQRLARRAIDRLGHAVIAVSRRNAALRSQRLGARGSKFAAVLNGVPIRKIPECARVSYRRRHRFT